MSNPTTDTPQGWSFESIKESYLDADLSESWLRSAVAFLLAELRQVEERNAVTPIVLREVIRLIEDGKGEAAVATVRELLAAGAKEPRQAVTKHSTGDSS